MSAHHSFASKRLQAREVVQKPQTQGNAAFNVSHTDHSTARSDSCLLTRKVSWSPSQVIVRAVSYSRELLRQILCLPPRPRPPRAAAPRLTVHRPVTDHTFGDLGTRWLSLYAGYKGDIREGGEEMG